MSVHECLPLLLASLAAFRPYLSLPVREFHPDPSRYMGYVHRSPESFASPRHHCVSALQSVPTEQRSSIGTHRQSQELLSQRHTALTTLSMPPNLRDQAQSQEWNLSSFLKPGEGAPGNEAYAVVVLNTSLSNQYKQTVQRVWQNASVRVCADGAANGLLDMIGYDGWDQLPLPTLVCGDLDSIRDETREFFAARGVEIRRLPSVYATDLQKSIQAIEDLEKQLSIDTYPLVILGGLSGRLDQTMHTLHVLWQLAPGVETGAIITESCPAGEETPRGSRLEKRAKTLVVSDSCMTCLLCAGEHRVDNDRDLLGPSCGILPLGAGPSGVHVKTHGLEWNLYGEASFLGGFLSTSNRLAPDNPHGRVEIQADAPVYWTVELRQDM